jgi:oxygen-independent coproporphyrinogen-3 oxidase
VPTSATLALKYDRPVPRYTSYPTAPQFTAAHTPEIQKRWLSEIPLNRAASIYVHMPFCQSLCWYCGCSMKVSRDEGQIQTYADAVCREIEMVAARTGPLTIGHIHFGGGTPTWGPSRGLAAILAAVRRCFHVDAGAEIALEADPRSLSDHKADALADLGVNRVSLGVQDLDDDVQKAINRRQPFDVVARGVESLRARRIDRINLDLMYGLPLQTEKSIERTVDQCVTLSPQRFALFGYAHVPWIKRHQKLLERHPIPDAAQRLELFTAAESRLNRYAFKRVGLDHFARHDDEMAAALRRHTLHRNFQGYTTDTAGLLLGFGATAISALPQGYSQNEVNVKSYITTIAAGQIPTVRGRALSEEDRTRRAMIMELMCYFSVIVPDDLRDRLGLTLAELESDGLIRWDGAVLNITDKGRPWVRVAATAFDAYFQPVAGRHSRAM